VARRLLLSLAISFFCFIAVIFRGVAAETISISRETKLTAVVLPARTIITDQQNQITKIISNTPENITPVVYKNTVGEGRQQALTDDVYSQYKRLLARSSSKIGVIYERQNGLTPSLQPKIALDTNVLSL
jgi:hypothetical protein